MRSRDQNSINCSQIFGNIRPQLRKVSISHGPMLTLSSNFMCLLFWGSKLSDLKPCKRFKLSSPLSFLLSLSNVFISNLFPLETGPHCVGLPGLEFSLRIQQSVNLQIPVSRTLGLKACATLCCPSNIFKNWLISSCRDGSVVQNPLLLWRTWIGSQHPHGNSQLPVDTVLRVPKLFSDFC